MPRHLRTDSELAALDVARGRLSDAQIAAKRGVSVEEVAILRQQNLQEKERARIERSKATAEARRVARLKAKNEAVLAAPKEDLTRVPWLQVVQDYRDPSKTATEIAAKYGLNYRTIVNYMSSRGISRGDNAAIRRSIQGAMSDPDHVPAASPTLAAVERREVATVDEVKSAHELDVRRAHLIVRRLTTHLEEHLRTHEPKAQGGEGVVMSAGALNNYAMAGKTIADTLKNLVSVEREIRGIGVSTVDPLEAIKKLSNDQLLDNISVLLKETKIDLSGIETTRTVAISASTVERPDVDTLKASSEIIESEAVRIDEFDPAGVM